MNRDSRDISIKSRTPGLTIGAAPFFQRTAILHVMTNAIRVLQPDGTERQTIPDKDGNMPRPKIRACSISDPFVLVLREDDSIGLFIGEAERGKIRRKDMSPMGDKVSQEEMLLPPADLLIIFSELKVSCRVFLHGYHGVV